jgi:hypothetical protein
MGVLFALIVQQMRAYLYGLLIACQCFIEHKKKQAVDRLLAEAIRLNASD